MLLAVRSEKCDEMLARDDCVDWVAFGSLLSFLSLRGIPEDVQGITAMSWMAFGSSCSFLSLLSRP